MMGKRRKKLRIVDLPAEKARPIAASSPLACLGEGYDLASPCRFWERKDGSWTDRFVYQHPANSTDTVTVTIKGLRFA